MANRYTVQFTKSPYGTTKRTIRNVPPLNDGDAVVVGNRAMVITPKSAITPQFGVGVTIAEGDLYLQTSTSTSVIKPVEIIGVTNPGTSGAVATVMELNYQGVLATSGHSYSNVVPVPYRHMAAIGMKGIYFTHSAPSGSVGQRASVGFIALPLTLIGRLE